MLVVPVARRLLLVECLLLVVVRLFVYCCVLRGLFFGDWFVLRCQWWLYMVLIGCCLLLVADLVRGMSVVVDSLLVVCPLLNVVRCHVHVLVGCSGWW